jgi:hypothetical protein
MAMDTEVATQVEAAAIKTEEHGQNNTTKPTLEETWKAAEVRAAIVAAPETVAAT